MIKGKNISLWALEKYDLLANFKWANDRELINLTGMPRFPKSIMELENWYNESLKNPSNKFFSIKTKTGNHIGNIELNSIDWINKNLEIGIIIGEKNCQGKGLGKEATLLALNFIFEQMDFHRVYLSVSSHNTPAIKLYEKCGFTREGIKREAYFFNNSYYDVIEMGILRKEFEEVKRNFVDLL